MFPSPARSFSTSKPHRFRKASSASSATSTRIRNAPGGSWSRRSHRHPRSQRSLKSNRPHHRRPRPVPTKPPPHRRLLRQPPSRPCPMSRRRNRPPSLPICTGWCIRVTSLNLPTVGWTRPKSPCPSHPSRKRNQPRKNQRRKVIPRLRRLIRREKPRF